MPCSIKLLLLVLALSLVTGCAQTWVVEPASGTDVWYRGGELVADEAGGMRMVVGYQGKLGSKLGFYSEFRNDGPEPVTLDPDAFFLVLGNSQDVDGGVQDLRELQKDPGKYGVIVNAPVSRRIRGPVVLAKPIRHLGLIDRVAGENQAPVVMANVGADTRVDDRLRKITLQPGETVGGVLEFKDRGRGTTLLLVMPVGERVMAAKFLRRDGAIVHPRKTEKDIRDI